MRLCHLHVENFRGIHNLDWIIRDRVVTLVGPGDSAKTTILDAIALLGLGRSNISFVDSDFFQGNSSSGFVIQGTITELPGFLLDERRFGMDLCGVDDQGLVHPEAGDHHPALTIRLAVDESLDATWSVVSASSPDGRPIGPRDRSLLGITRLGSDVDRQFSWARGTALTRATADRDEVASVLAAAYRDAQSAVAATDLSGLSLTVEGAKLAAEQIGAGEMVEQLRVRMELTPATGSGLSLHAGDVPVARLGLGTRRLLALGLELRGTESGSLVCIDEIEHGLEPHRLQQLLTSLRKIIGTGEDAHGQAFLTTHSPITLELVGTDGLHVVRADGGEVAVRRVPDEVIKVVRANPSALLARRVIVCEGRTEVGMLQGVAETWAHRHQGRPVTHAGATFVFGNGRTEAPTRALRLAELGYPVLVVADSDEPLNPSADDLIAAGIVVVLWDGGMATEQRVAADVTWETLWSLLQYVADLVGDERAVTSMLWDAPSAQAALARLALERTSAPLVLADFVTCGISQSEIREAFGLTAKARSWFKNFDRAADLGRTLAMDPELQTTDLGRKLSTVEAWCYGGA